ncbi:hypothetical protein MRX96_028985 [Rhipicephalus microplus]
MQPAILSAKASAAPTPRAQSRRGSLKPVGEELFGILKSGKSRRRRRKRRSRSLRWVNIPDESTPFQPDAAAPAATARGTRPQQAAPAGLGTGVSLGPLMYTAAGVPAPPVPTAAVVVPPEQELQEPPPQGVNYNGRRYLLDREERVADVAAISPAVLSPAYGVAMVLADPSPYAPH